jgi:cell division transport system permease protein
MLRRRTDLPLDGDTASRVLPWIIALMVYLAALALAGTMLLNGLAARWDAGLAGTLTVQIPPSEEPAASDAAAAADERLAAALNLLRTTPGVGAAEPLARKDIAALLEPWLGPGSRVAELPLPQLIDVSLEQGGDLDLAALARRLAEAVPGAEIEDHAHWRRQLVSLARSIELTTLLVVLLIAAAAILVVIFATQAGLSAHRDVIDVLHLVGARDDYVARQFQDHMVRKGLFGGAVGVLLAVATLYGFAHAAGDIEAVLLPRLGLAAGDWLLLAALVPAAALITMITARVTVRRVLGRLP